MLTVKVVVEWVGTPSQPGPNPKEGYMRPSEHIFEATSVYNDAGQIICHGVPDGGPPGSDEPGSVTYNTIYYSKPWRQTMYVMNARGATISKFDIGYQNPGVAGDECEARIAPSPWHPQYASDGMEGDCPEGVYDPQSRREQTGVALGAAAA